MMTQVGLLLPVTLRRNKSRLLRVKRYEAIRRAEQI